MKLCVSTVALCLPPDSVPLRWPSPQLAAASERSLRESRGLWRSCPSYRALLAASPSTSTVHVSRPKRRPVPTILFANASRRLIVPSGLPESESTARKPCRDFVSVACIRAVTVTLVAHRNRSMADAFDRRR